MFIIEAKNGLKAKWKQVWGGNRYPTYEAALIAACQLDQDGLEPDGKTVRIRQIS